MDQAETSPSAQRMHSRGFSFHSHHSKSSDKSGSHKQDHGESPKEKARRDQIWKNSTKANPNSALAEDQPGVANLLEQSTLQNIRSYQHRDSNGNPIAEPDLSNPTRPRFERPLDTIKSFERAIDNGYKRRASYQKQEAPEPFDEQNTYASRRSSYFGGYDNNGPSPNGRHHSPAAGPGYYGQQHRSEGYHTPGGGPQQPRTRLNPRMQSDPSFVPRPYPQHSYHQSHDTVNTGVTHASDSTGPWASGTDPSSENSSIDRAAAAQGYGQGKPSTPGYDYAHGGYGAGHHGQPIAEEGGDTDDYGMYARPNGSGGGAPPVQHPGAGGARRPIPLGGGGGAQQQGGQLPSTARAEPQKRQSWIKRKFAKKE